MQGRSQKSGNGGAKILDRKPHLLINAETGSDYYSVRVPAKKYIFCNKQRNVDELGVIVEVTGAATLLANPVVRTERFFHRL